MVLRSFAVLLALLAVPAWALAEDAAPTTEAGRQAAARLADHAAALEVDDLAKAEVARQALAALVAAGDGAAETTWLYARALAREAVARRRADDAAGAATLAQTLDVLALAADADDATRAERVFDLGDRWLQLWDADRAASADRALALLRTWVSGADAGPKMLDSWVWVLDEVHRAALEAEAFGRAEAVLDEMRAVLDERGRTGVRVGEMLRSLARYHLHLRRSGNHEAGDRILQEMRRRDAPEETTPPSEHLGDALVDLQRYTAEDGLWVRSDAALEELRAIARTHDTPAARSDLLTALGNTIFDHGRLRDGLGIPQMTAEARTLGRRADVDDRMRAEYVRALRNACLHEAAQGREAEAEVLRAEAAALVAPAGASEEMQFQYAALLADAIRRYLDRDAFGPALAFLEHGRALVAVTKDSPPVRERFVAMLVDVHILAERGESPAARAARLPLLDELTSYGRGPDATEAMRADLARGLYNRHLDATRRGEAPAAAAALTALRTLAKERPDEPVIRGELLHVLRKDHEDALPGDAARAAGLLAEARALVGETSPPLHRSILLRMITAALWQAEDDERVDDVAALERDLRMRTVREDLDEDERRYRMTGLRYLAQHAADDGAWPRARALLEELRGMAGRPEATALQISEFARALEVLARRRFENGAYALGLALCVELRTLAAREDAAPYVRERCAWAIVDAQRAAREAKDTRTSSELAAALQAMAGEHREGDALEEALARMLGNEERHGAEQDATAYADRVTGLLRALADGDRSTPRIHDELAFVLDRRIWRALDEAPIDWPAVNAAVAELRRRARKETASEFARNELADTLMRVHAELGDAREWSKARGLLDELRVLARRPTATARQRGRLAEALADETWDAGIREDWAELHAAVAELSALAEADPEDVTVHDQLTRAYRIAHQKLGETDEYIAPALEYLGRLRTLIGASEAASPYQWTEWANALGNAVNFAQFDVDVDAAHRVLDELRALCRSPTADEEQRFWWGFALRHLVRACRLPADRARMEGYLAELETLASRPAAKEDLRTELSRAWGHAWDAVPEDADPGDGVFVLEALRRLARAQRATPGQRDVRVETVADAYTRYVDQGHAAAAAALARELADLAQRPDATDAERDAWPDLLQSAVDATLEGGAGTMSDPAWQALRGWALRPTALPALRRSYAATLVRAARAARAAVAPERAAGFFRALEEVIAADPEDTEVVRMYRAALGA